MSGGGQLYSRPMNEDSRAADAAYFSDLTDGADFFLLRHGESEGNARLIIQGTLDLPLTGRGEAQAAAAGEWLATKGVIRILTSPLSRALRTAQIIADRARLPAPEPDPVFTELDTGAFTGLDMDGIRERHPEAYAEFLWRSWDAVP
ncbi:MAG TPA: histidine phosphatase family protein, partial [Magnetospirillaceae bacterium]|nr:histidine phosphatase family protein [Magnetospirillaceae bacterium]